MKLIHFHRKPISMFVMLTFAILLCFWSNQAPAAPATEKNSETTMEQGENNSPGFIEEESEGEASVKKPHKFPWLLVGAVVVVGAALYFLVLKKKPMYTLTVTLGAGTTGTPVTNKYKEGTAVPYSFSAASGYVDLQVMLDGAVVPASGSVTMDKDHAITTSATQRATIQVESSPAGAKIYLNKVDSGHVTPFAFNYSAATTKEVILRLGGYQDYTKSVTANLGQNIVVSHTFLPGIKEDFIIPASSSWKPYITSEWTVAGGVYKCSTTTHSDWKFNYYNKVFGSSTYVVEVKVKKVLGTENSSIAILLASSTNMAAVNGYLFNYTANGGYSIWRETNWNWITASGTSKPMKEWDDWDKINKGLNAWNIMKIVRSGSNYSYYLNGSLLTSFSDANHDPRVVVLTFYTSNMASEVQYDYVKLNVGSALGLMPPDTAIVSTPITNQKHSGYK